MDYREQRILITELTHGKDLAKQLRSQLNPASSSSPEARDNLIQKILSSYDKALSMLNNDSSLKSNKLDFSILETPPCSFPNVISPSSDKDCKVNVCKKRKTMPQWTEQVKVCMETRLEGTLDDGYYWRKYGKKVILGAHFPRGYYRCIHRHTQGCVATKQVQRSNADPKIFEVTYRGRHTCSQNSDHSAPLASTSTTREVSIDQNKIHCNQQKENEVGLTELKVKSEEYLDAGESNFPSLHYTHESMVENNLFLDSLMENHSNGSFLPAFIPLATSSESNYFSVSPCHKTNNFGLGSCLNVQTPDSGLIAEIISAPTSVTNSPFGDFDFSLAEEDLHTNFQFDNLDSCF